MSTSKRTQQFEDRQHKHDHILRTARGLLERNPMLDTTMADIAERSGVAKGTLFLYFPTREALMLSMLTIDIVAWFDELDQALEEGGRWTQDRVVHMMAQSVTNKPFFMRLLARLELTFQRAHGTQAAADFNAMLYPRMTKTGELLERRLPFLKAGEGAWLLLHARAQITGLWLMADSPPEVVKVLKESPLNHLFVDFIKEFSASMTAFLRGVEVGRA
ncbi:MAG: TetR family transcriptional regulator [Deltaproteobacteria bacterium]|nr:TetR family transcriptional regulator [Deltaproteobacteria bacterium]